MWTTPSQHRLPPSQWQPLRRKVIEKAMGQCEAMQVFDLNTGIEERCPYPGVDVDHIINLKSGGTNDLSNLQYLCTYHHRKKTEREARAARKYVSRNHPGEPHPGIKP